MGFNIHHLSFKQRALQVGPHDDAIKKACNSCDYRNICGGFWVWDDSRWCDENCVNCLALCCHKPTWRSDAARIGGLSFDDIHWKPWSTDWPDMIWVVGGRTGGLPEPVYVIPVDSLMDRFSLCWAHTPDLHERFSIPASSKIGISFCFQDHRLRRFRDHEDVVADALSKFNVDFVLPINYSVYRNYPRLDQLVAMRRRMLSMKLFQERGLNVIPDVGIIRDVDIDRWADWITREKCSSVFMTVQTMQGKVLTPRYRIQFGNMLKFREKIGPDVRILLQGVSATRMAFFASQLGKVSFINHAAWVKAELRLNAATDEGLRGSGYTVQDTFALNVNLLKRILYATRSSSVSSAGGSPDG